MSEGAAGSAVRGVALRAGAQLFLDACAEPEVERIILLDAPAVLGWEAWRYLAGRYGLGLIQLAPQPAMGAHGNVPPPVVPPAHPPAAPAPPPLRPRPSGGPRPPRRGQPGRPPPPPEPPGRHA